MNTNIISNMKKIKNKYLDGTLLSKELFGDYELVYVDHANLYNNRSSLI
jgi:hypothetical protein